MAAAAERAASKVGGAPSGGLHKRLPTEESARRGGCEIIIIDRYKVDHSPDQVFQRAQIAS